MELFTVYLGQFIEPGGLTPPLVLPSYLPPERRQGLLTLLASGLGNLPMLFISWNKDTPRLENRNLIVRDLSVNTEGSLLVIAVMNDEELSQAQMLSAKTTARLVVYDVGARCRIEHNKWLYDLKRMLIKALKEQVHRLLGNALTNMDLTFPLHAFSDPLDILDFWNIRVTVHIEGLCEPEATWETFARLMAKKMRLLSFEDLVLLLRLVTTKTRQIVSLSPDEAKEEVLSRLERVGLLLFREQKATLQLPALCLRKVELLERTVVHLGVERLGSEGEGLYRDYLIRMRLPRPEGTSVALIEAKEISAGPGLARLNEIEKILQQQAQRLGIVLLLDDEDALHLLQQNLLADGGSRRALGLAIGAYRNLLSGHLTEALEDAALSRRSDPLLKDFVLAVLFYSGEDALFRWRLDDALEYFQSYLSQGGDPVRAHLKLGETYYQLGQWEQAIDLLQQTVFEAHTAANRWQEGTALNSLGNVYTKQSRWKEAIQCFNQSLNIFQELNDRHGLAQTLNNLGIIYDDQGRWEEAIECFKQNLEIKQELEDKHGQAQTFNNLGVVYKNQGHLAEAIQYYKQSLNIFKELGDRSGQAATLSNLGVVYMDQGLLEEAIKYYEQSLNISKELGDRHGQAMTLNNLGLVYDNQGRFEEAIKFFKQSLEIKQELGDRHGQAKTLSNLSHIYVKKSEPQKALIVAKEALCIFEELNAIPDLIICHRKMASIAIHTGDISTCSHHLSQALSLSLELHIRVVLETLGDIVDIAKKLTKEGKFFEAAKLGEGLFEQLVVKKEWRSEELKSAGMLVKSVCEVIALVGRNKIEKISEKEIVKIIKMANDVDETTNKIWNLKELVHGVYLS